MLLEREESLLALDAALARIGTSGPGELGTVAGEADVGKSSLLRAFTNRTSPGALVLWGACDALRTPRPLGPLLDLAPTAGPALQTAVLESAPREAIFAAALATLRDRERPVVMVIEDAHIVAENATEGVTWVHSYVTPDRQTTFCIYDAGDPEAVRRAAARNGLPVERITEVRVLDPYFYTASQ